MKHLFYIPALTILWFNSSSAKVIDAGVEYSVVLCSDSTVWATGLNYYGSLGDSTTVDKNYPVRTKGLNQIIAIDCGGLHNLALDVNGKVYAWGANDFGQIGDSSIITRIAPIQIPGLINIIAIAAGDAHSLALQDDGTVWAWGGNWEGQLGDGTTTDRNYPLKIPGLTGIVAIETGWEHSLALRFDGTLWGWGRNAEGALGNGTNVQSIIPVQVTGLTNMVQISAGNNFSSGLRNDGKVFTWGYNARGQLGDGTTLDKNVPVQIAGLSGGVYIVCGTSHMHVIKSDSTTWAWGRNLEGQYGDGSKISTLTPTIINGFNGIIRVAAEQTSTIALTSTGSVIGTGFNQKGQLGDSTNTSVTSPVQMKLSCTVTTHPPAASFTFSDNFLDATFTNTSANYKSSAWDFGDGTFSDTTNPTHTYAAQGTYNVCLTVFNPCGWDRVCQTVEVDTCPLPVADFGFIKSGLQVTFSDSSSDAAAWLWNFGDGNTNNIQSPVHTYGSASTYTVTLIVTNPCGEKDTTVRFITVISGIDGRSLEDQILLHPNPVTNTLIVSFENPGTYRLKLFNTLGEILLSSSVRKDNHIFDLSALPPGVYLLKITDSRGGSAVKRVVKVK